MLPPELLVTRTLLFAVVRTAVLSGRRETIPPALAVIALTATAFDLSIQEVRLR